MHHRDHTDHQTVQSFTITRRTALRTLTGAGATFLALVGAGHTALGQTVVGEAVTTANLNLRSGPGTSHPVLRVMPKGSLVMVYNKGSAGFLMVSHGDTRGYAAAAYLAPAGSNPPEHLDTGTAKTLANVNLRSGPSTDHQVLRVVALGSRVSTTGTLRNGFRYVSHDGLAGWISNEYLSWNLGGEPTGETFTTTANLRLRALPNTSSNILLVMPSGSVVKAMNGKADGFREVSYRGTAGWAATAYLN